MVRERPLGTLELAQCLTDKFIAKFNNEQMKLIKWLAPFQLILLTASTTTSAGEVEKICKTKIPVVELEFRQGSSNFAKLKSTNLGPTPVGKFLSDFYKNNAYPQPEKSMVDLVYAANEKLLPASDLKSRFLKFATSNQRLKDPTGYRETVIDLVKNLIPESRSKLQWYLDLKDPQLASTQLAPASGMEMNDVYGAVARLSATDNNKFYSQIVFSNNESEPIPYLLPLIVHELHHASTYKDRIKIHDNEQESFAYGIVDEAIAFDIQMATYLELARKSPEIFCNWMYVTWSYGEIPVPLAWTMASMEKELGGGKYIYNYAKMGPYKNAPYLLNANKDDLRADIKQRIKSLNLKFVK
jgi:hypothetical protein